MLTGVWFEVLAKIPLNYLRAPFYASERDLARELLQDVVPGDLLLLDRGYPGYEMFHALSRPGVDFLARLPKDGLFKEAQEFPARGKRDGKITLHAPKNLRQAHPDTDFPPLTLRLLAVALPGAQETAVFITTRLAGKKHPRRSLRKLYHYRWAKEEYRQTLKEHLRAEEFRGHRVQFIDQEPVSTYLYYTLTKILMLKVAQQQAIPGANLETKAALVAVARYLDRLLPAKSLPECSELLRRCLAEISRRKHHPRPGRKFPPKSNSRHGKGANKWC